MLAKLLQVSTAGQLWPPSNWRAGGLWCASMNCTELNAALKQQLLLELEIAISKNARSP